MLAKRKLVFGKKLIETANSPINGKINIYYSWRWPVLEVGGLEQSGPFIAGIWKKGLKNVQKFKGLKVQNVLILGLGAGTAARLVNQFWPKSEITGIEIDPKIIKMGKKYFNLDKIPNLKIACSDVNKWIHSRHNNTHYNNTYYHSKHNFILYDLILVDLYLGDQVPISCETKTFLKNIKSLLAPNGLAVFNRLYYRDKKKEAENFIKKLETIFQRLTRVRTPSNLLILAQKG